MQDVVDVPGEVVGTRTRLFVVGLPPSTRPIGSFRREVPQLSVAVTLTGASTICPFFVSYTVGTSYQRDISQHAIAWCSGTTANQLENLTNVGSNREANHLRLKMSKPFAGQAHTSNPKGRFSSRMLHLLELGLLVRGCGTRTPLWPSSAPQVRLGKIDMMSVTA
jgi:hypothetical protein